MKQSEIDNKIKEYREKHPRCKYCKYKKLIYTPPAVANDIWKCTLKDKFNFRYSYNLEGDWILYDDLFSIINECSSRLVRGV